MLMASLDPTGLCIIRSCKRKVVLCQVPLGTGLVTQSAKGSRIHGEVAKLRKEL